MSNNYYHLYTDGSTFNSENLQLASSVYYITKNDRIVYRGAKGYKDKTISFAEINAVIWGLKKIDDLLLAKEDKPIKINVYCDSEFVIKGINEYSNKWALNGWKNSDNKEVAYADMFKILKYKYLHQTKLYKISFKHIPRKLDESNPHSILNRKCDTYAKEFIKRIKSRYGIE